MPPSARKQSKEKIDKQLEKLEDQVFLKKLKPKEAYKKMVVLACELACADQSEEAILILVKIPKDYFMDQQVKDAQEDNDYALNIVVLFECLLIHFEKNPEISPNLSLAEA